MVKGKEEELVCMNRVNPGTVHVSHRPLAVLSSTFPRTQNAPHLIHLLPVPQPPKTFFKGGCCARSLPTCVPRARKRSGQPDRGLPRQTQRRRRRRRRPRRCLRQRRRALRGLLKRRRRRPVDWASELGLYLAVSERTTLT